MREERLDRDSYRKQLEALYRTSRRVGIRRRMEGSGGLSPAVDQRLSGRTYYANRLASPLLEAEESAAVLTYSKAKPINMNGSTAVTAAIDATVRNCQGTRTYAQIQPASQNGDIPAM